MADFFKQYSAVQSGTIVIENTKQDVVLVHNNTSLSSTLTITFPPGPRDGQRFTVVSAFGVTTLTISTAIPRVGVMSSIAAGGYATWMYCARANKWFRCG